MGSAAGRHTASGTKKGRCRFRGFRDRQWTPLDHPYVKVKLGDEGGWGD